MHNQIGRNIADLTVGLLRLEDQRPHRLALIIDGRGQLGYQLATHPLHILRGDSPLWFTTLNIQEESILANIRALEKYQYPLQSDVPRLHRNRWLQKSFWDKVGQNS